MPNYQQSKRQELAQSWLTLNCDKVSETYPVQHIGAEERTEFIYYCGLVNHALQEVHAFNNRYTGLD